MNANLLKEKLIKEAGTCIMFLDLGLDESEIYGLYQGKGFNITYKEDKYLLVSFEENSNRELSEFIEIANKVIKVPPLCKYDMVLEEDNIKITYPTAEWINTSKERRIEEFLKGKAFDNVKVKNLIFFGESNIIFKTEEQPKVKLNTRKM